MADYLYTVDFGVIKNPTNDLFSLHSHLEYEILIFLDGDSKYVVEEKNYDLEPDDIVIIRNREMHRVYHNSKKDYSRIVMMVSPDFFIKYNCPEYERIFFEESKQIGNRICADVVHSSGLYDAILRLKKYSDNFSTLHSPVVDCIMVEILYLINKISVFENADTTNNTVKNIICYINNHYTETISLDKLSEQLFVSKYHLCHTFKNLTGLTIQEYITQKRLTLVDVLRKEGKTLTESALLSGFGDYSSFYRARAKQHKKSFIL